jgi:hypothetical protein
MSYIAELLKEIRRRPGMYIGWPSLSRLSGFLRGYDYALFKLQGAPGDPFFLSFQEWIERRLQVKHEFWENAILQQAGSEADAFHRFWVLLDEYYAEQERGDQQANGATAQNPTTTKEPHP